MIYSLLNLWLGLIGDENQIHKRSLRGKRQVERKRIFENFARRVLKKKCEIFGDL